MPKIPENFDGTRFQEKFDKTIDDFRIFKGELVCPSLPDLTDQDISDCIVDINDFNLKNEEFSSAKLEIVEQYRNSIDRLSQIISAPRPTTFSQNDIGKLFDAVQDLAKYERFIIKLIGREYL